MWRILGGSGMLTKLTRDEKRSRYMSFMAEHAPILIGVHSFILGVLLTNGFYQLLLVSLPKWPDSLITLSAMLFSGNQLLVALKATKQRGDGND
jgi:hypothetical protein